MRDDIFTLRYNRRVAENTYEMRLDGDTSAITAPGQFAELDLPGHFLRRPFSVCDWDGEGLTILYKLTGEGTLAMSRMRHGKKLGVLTGLGNGFDASKSGGVPLLIGGGTGASPLLGLAKRLAAEGKRATVILGFATAKDAVLTDALAYTGARVILTTEDGSRGRRGLVTDAMTGFIYSRVYACGPEAMLRAAREKAKTAGDYSLEARMGCGFGVCMGCTIETSGGPRRVCKDGPVFSGEELLW